MFPLYNWFCWFSFVDPVAGRESASLISDWQRGSSCNSLSNVWPHISVFKTVSFFQVKFVLQNCFTFLLFASQILHFSSSVPVPLLVFLLPGDILFSLFLAFWWYDYLVKVSQEIAPFSPYFPCVLCLWPSGAVALYPHRSYPWLLILVGGSQPAPALYDCVLITSSKVILSHWWFVPSNCSMNKL